MNKTDPLDQLLRDCCKPVPVSADFKRQLWSRLMKPAPVVLIPSWSAALAAAVFLGVFTGTMQAALPVARAADHYQSVLNRHERWDLFGDAPHDTLAGSVIRLSAKGDKP
jgi:hypothetical protein